MYSIVKNVLDQGGYDLASIVKKIDTLWLQGKLTDEQHKELTEQARSGANYQDSIDVLDKLNSLEKRIEALENAEASTAEFPAYITGKQYLNGDKCAFGGKNYICIAPDGAVCVWSPEDYPAYWEVAA